MNTARLSDFLRGFADGLDAAAGRDPVDQHAQAALTLVREGMSPADIAQAVLDDDPDEVVVPTADVDEDQVIRLGLDLQEARRENTALRAQLAASPAPPFGPQQPLDAKLAEKNRDPDVQVLVDAARDWAKSLGDYGHLLGPEGQAVINSVRKIDGEAPIPNPVAT